MGNFVLAQVNIAIISDVHFWGLLHMQLEVPLGPPEPRLVECPTAEADGDDEGNLT